MRMVTTYLKLENKITSKKEILKMYEMKTGILFSYCCIAPFIMKVQSNKNINFAKNYSLTPSELEVTAVRSWGFWRIWGRFSKNGHRPTGSPGNW